MKKRSDFTKEQVRVSNKYKDNTETVKTQTSKQTKTAFVHVLLVGS